MKNIALIEDSEPLQELYRQILSVAGYELTILVNGAKSLELIAKTKPDIVLLDVMLPDMPGDILLEKIRKLDNGKDLKVLALTNMSNEKVRQKLLDLGALDVLIKIDYDPDELVEVVESYLS